MALPSWRSRCVVESERRKWPPFENIDACLSHVFLCALFYKLPLPLHFVVYCRVFSAGIRIELGALDAMDAMDALDWRCPRLSPSPSGRGGRGDAGCLRCHWGDVSALASAAWPSDCTYAPRLFSPASAFASPGHCPSPSTGCCIILEPGW
ncbi:hypothetical protein THAOC_06349 [Thalassiosira oceanica]|uniref:Uncharacterized protein n=1 Tax=Thalassiosira oceanica TaxID=159749 RepID=K0TLU4_THAOC|nr:hypothetical protein THAOC_06349 [Thalassiosira oceanica]|eukprot:EJK72147.1 hypothetical protein THAOC_06349 [Thalassiosira oceanica]